MTVYSYNDSLKAATEYFHGDDLAATTWLAKYAMKDNQGNLLELTPLEMHLRMAAEFARIENKYGRIDSADERTKSLSEYGKSRSNLDESKIMSYLENFRYVIPQGSVMSALGNKNTFASLSNCVVLPEIYDSYGGIFFADQQLAQLFKRRCGVGLDLSSVRPEGSIVANSAGTTTGAVSFMERFSNTTREVSQNGRRGALMITMDIAHPDIEKFITIKQDLKKVTGANISVRLSDEFMQAVEEDKEFILRFPVMSESPIVSRKINAKKLWELIVSCAHKTAEPGLIFWDRQHVYSTSSLYPGFKNVSTNPCSEIAMQGGDSCRLIAINLFSFVREPFSRNAVFDFEKFYEVTYDAQRLCDDLVDLELEAIERILSKVENDPEPAYIKDVELKTWRLLHKSGKAGRRTGLGFTALADALAALNISFGSEEALVMTENIMRKKCEAEFDSSIDMAIERGSFGDFNPAVEKKSGFIEMMKKEFPVVHDRMMRSGRRNISISTVAPTGTLSLLTQTSSGIEPVFMLSYKRRRKINPKDENVNVNYVDDLGDSWQEFIVHHHGIKKWMETSGESDISKSPYHGSTAEEINWRYRIKLQSVVQKYTTHSISSTINLDSSEGEDLIGRIYLTAWKEGLKGITVYRSGSRSGVLVKAEENSNKVLLPAPNQRPEILEASVVRFMNSNERWVAYIGLLDRKPYEIFTGRAEDAAELPENIESGFISRSKSDGKASYDFLYTDDSGSKRLIEGLSNAFNSEYWNYAKLLSRVMRNGLPLQEVIRLADSLYQSNENINSWKAGVKRALRKFIPDGTVAGEKCSQCGADTLVYESGCLICKNCGAGRCD